MNLAFEAPAWLTLILSILLFAAGLQDAVRLRISNLISGLILVGGIVAAILAGPQWSLWQNLLVLIGLLAAGMPLFAAGKLGGGDVKLFAATGFWFDLSGALHFLAAAFIAGGVLAVIILALRLVRWRDGVVRRVRVLKKGAGIPYGVAIAAGALIAIAMQRS